MIAFSGMLVPAAEKVGMKVPENLDSYNKRDYPHFYVFSLMQLGAPMPYAGVHFDNAKVIADLSDEEIKTLTTNQIYDKGFKTGYSYAF